MKRKGLLFALILSLGGTFLMDPALFAAQGGVDVDLPLWGRLGSRLWPSTGFRTWSTDGSFTKNLQNYDIGSTGKKYP